MVYLVFGTGRSGTSFVADVLHNDMGISMGNEFVPSNKSNPGGFWEDVDFYNLNNAFIYDGLSYTEFMRQAGNLSSQRAKNGSEWGFKESRMAYLLALYLLILNDACLIWAYRNKEATVKSMVRWYGWSEEKAATIFTYREHCLNRTLEGRKCVGLDFSTQRSRQYVKEAIEHGQKTH